MPSEINQFNLNAGVLNKYKNELFGNNYFWHQVVVENVEGLDRDQVLRPITIFCQPMHFIPVHYEAKNNTASFLLKNCGGAIQKLCSHKLILPNPHNKDLPFKFTIKLCYASSNSLKINIHANLMNILNRRFNQETGVMNLKNFAKDAELEEYCSLSQPKLFFYILHLVKYMPFKILQLQNNNIEFLKSMEALDCIKLPITIDLRNNNIKEISEIENLKHLPVTELWLDGNPICNDYDEITYGKAIKNCLEKLEKLDGINVQLKGCLPFRRNFLCELTGFDLVDQFLEHYFSLYDAQNRSILEGLYHKDALFSLTSMYLPSQTTSANANLSAYKQVSRNLKHMVDFARNTQCLYAGPSQILRVLSLLPLSEHDPYSFTADLVMHSKTVSVLVVTGVFRECSDSLLETDRILGFSRTFVLLAGKSGDYSIINEMLNVTNATTAQAARAFKQIGVPKAQFIFIPRPQDDRERTELAEAFTAITELKMDWSHKCLEECKYDLKDALNLFIDLHKKDKIPKSAFLSEEEKLAWKNRPKPIPQMPQHVAPSMVSPVHNVRPIGVVQRAQAPPARSGGYSFPQPSSGALSPDHIWDKYATTRDTPAQDNFDDLIDLISSPEEESAYEPEGLYFNEPERTKPAAFSNRNKANTSKGSYPSGFTLQEDSLPESTLPMEFTSNKFIRAAKLRKSPVPPEKLTKKQLKQIQEEATHLELVAYQRSYREKGFKDSLEEGLNLISKHKTEIDIFEGVMTFLYKMNVEHARLFNDRIHALSSWMTPFLSSNLIDLLIAKCEYMYGDAELGEKAFQKTMAKRLSWARPVTDFCKAMLHKGEVTKARELLRPYITGDHPLKVKMIRIAQLISQDYGVALM